MSKQSIPGYEADDEFIAQLDFLRQDHDNALRPLNSKSRISKNSLPCWSNGIFQFHAVS